MCPAIPLGTTPRLQFPLEKRCNGTRVLQAARLDAYAAQSRNGTWGVEVTVSWLDRNLEKRMKCGPYQGFISPAEAQSWGIISCTKWIDCRKPEPSPFIPIPAQLEQNAPARRIVDRR